MSEKNETTFETTKFHFNMFELEARFWLKYFGMLDWAVLFQHEYLPNDRARCGFNPMGRTACLTLSTEWNTQPTETNVKQSAFHEVCELLLAPLWGVMQMKTDPSTQSDAWSEATHQIIRRMENTVYAQSKGIIV